MPSQPPSAGSSQSSSGLPRHVAVIMDGNGRWAKRRGLPRVAGHRKGQERVRELVTACGEKGISHLTVFAFSSENWERPADEVGVLMNLFARALEQEIEKLHRSNVRFRVIGDIARFNLEIQKGMQAAQTLTQDNTGLTFTIAANYGGHWDIARACAEIARCVAAGELGANEITPETVSRFVCLADAPAPDLFIRTSGEQRISNFLLWQLAYTELYFTSVPWPEFDREQFEQALTWYAGRQRRFGLTGEQIEAVRRA